MSSYRVDRINLKGMSCMIEHRSQSTGKKDCVTSAFPCNHLIRPNPNKWNVVGCMIMMGWIYVNDGVNNNSSREESVSTVDGPDATNFCNP